MIEEKQTGMNKHPGNGNSIWQFKKNNLST
jgi:hypothetical protein